MDFTPLFPHSSSSSSTVSPNGNYVLTSVGDRLVVRLSQSMEVIRSWRSEQELPNNSDPMPKRVLSSSGSTTEKLAAKSSTRSLQPTIPYLGNATNEPPPGTVQDDRRPPVLTSISFSPNSQYVCALLRQSTTSVIFLYSIEADQLAAEIKIGAEGVASGDKAIRWSPSGNSLVVWSDWNLRVTIWPLSNSQPKPVQLHHPKHGPHIGSSFSPTGRYLAMLCRQPGNYHDHIGIYDTLTWTCASLFQLSTELVDPTHLHWSPCGRYLAIVESALLDYRVELWSPTGTQLGFFVPTLPQKLNLTINPSSTDHHTHNPPDTLRRSHSDSLPTALPHKRKVSSQTNHPDQEADTNAHVSLGIRHIKWRPGGEYLAVGGWDSKVRLLNDLTWSSICEIDLSEISSARVLNEPREWIGRTRGHGIIPFEVESINALPSPLNPDYSKPNPTIGIKEIEWSPKGDYMAIRNDTMPNAVYVFAFRGSGSLSHSAPPDSAQPQSTVPLRPRLSSILHFSSPVRCLQWHPSLTQLVIVCATSAVYSWFPARPGLTLSTTNPSQLNDYCEGIGVPAGIPFNATSIQWNTTGDIMLISDKATFCLAFPISDDAENV
ncbi:hypothetical protein MJO28_002716 [Puccinia striiformis f. sp. tritici]|uniref:Uncharacterized protein n=1 Tax=Puccinia striiformis f. sp. tritici TaxID=168172 RepID=A0ACC0EU52_9BASI|nr:hypothetical protein Pst134EA_005313 [Puccinia striiformis f. sp. tritici]KAH9462508.1 hypothetical protein Pst134EB_006401 [Puccinia striiformis f. sp. tritici]KAH9471413.1 hypothetical protein Pst134EA_005313 [Puccinia striiformis f. sp. tritici]KAI7958925.1 hypothetical protein MJO28_002716 [Puccinia striiformis f. sp. tritici]KAI7964689.1 hypothetical protein MJO29_002787 [Puccinia striiformis f. sp. tritici]